jgi:hypothetical protein
MPRRRRLQIRTRERTAPRFESGRQALTRKIFPCYFSFLIHLMRP